MNDQPTIDDIAAHLMAAILAESRSTPKDSMAACAARGRHLLATIRRGDARGIAMHPPEEYEGRIKALQEEVEKLRAEAAPDALATVRAPTVAEYSEMVRGLEAEIAWLHETLSNSNAMREQAQEERNQCAAQARENARIREEIAALKARKVRLPEGRPALDDTPSGWVYRELYGVPRPLMVLEVADVTTAIRAAGVEVEP